MCYGYFNVDFYNLSVSLNQHTALSHIPAHNLHKNIQQCFLFNKKKKMLAMTCTKNQCFFLQCNKDKEAKTRHKISCNRTTATVSCQTNRERKIAPSKNKIKRVPHQSLHVWDC